MFNDSYSDSSFAGALVAIIFIALAMAILLVVAQWKIFTKAGKPGWHSIIPYLNVYDIYEICWSKNMAIVGVVLLILSSLGSGTTSISESDSSSVLNTLIGIASFAYFVVNIVCQVKLAKSFGKSGAFAIGLIFLSPIFLCILAFGDSYYVGPGGVPEMSGYPQPGFGQGPVYGQNTGYSQAGGYQTYGQPAQNAPTGYSNGSSSAGYDTFTSSSRAPYEGQNGFVAQGQAQPQNNPYDAQPQNGGAQNYGSTGNYGGSSNYSGTQNPFDSGNPYN